MTAPLPFKCTWAGVLVVDLIFLYVYFLFLQDIISSTPQISILIVALIIFLVVFFGGQFPVFQRASLSIGLSVLVISTVAAAAFISTHVALPSSPTDHVIPVFILIFATNAMMPLPRIGAVVVSICLAGAHLSLALFLTETKENLGRQVRLE